MLDLLTILHVGHGPLGLVPRFEGAHQFVLQGVWVGGRHFAFSAREVSGDKDPGLFTGGWHRAPPPANAYPALSSIANAVKVVSFIGRAPLSLF